METTGISFEERPVLVVGASMVGMTLNALLAKHGVKGCLAVEKHSSTAIHPRAALFHPRTMQIYRELGLYDAMVEESAKHYDQNAGIVDVESLAGKFNQTWLSNMNEGIENISPTKRLFLTQQMFEPVLREKCAQTGADLRFSTELLSFQADSQGVNALVRNTETGQKTMIRAQYMIACDGSRSEVRQALNIQMRGHGLLSHSLTIYFTADLGRFVQGKYNGVIYVNNPTVRGFFRLDKSGTEGFLVVNTAGEQGTKESRYPADTITDDKARELLRAAIGADVDFEVTMVAKWRALCDTADKFVDATGRVLLAGDAAHVVTPHGGFGGNTGVQDAHNLAWKLALVLQGKAGHTLVSETYEQERRRVAKKTVDQVFERYIRRTAPELREVYENQGMEIEEEAQDAFLELGYKYHSQALDTEREPEDVLEDPITSKARPGTIAHHVVVTLEQHDQEQALADLLGNSFVLVLASEADGWAEVARKFMSVGLNELPEIRTYRLKKETDTVFCSKYGISNAGAVMIRPDGFVAWTSSDAAVTGMSALGIPDPSKTLSCLMEKILCRKYESMHENHPSHFHRMVPDSKKQDVHSLSAALFAREKLLGEARTSLQKQLEQVETQLADVRRLSRLQDEMAMLSMKVLPVQDTPPEYNFSDCTKQKASFLTTQKHP